MNFEGERRIDGGKAELVDTALHLCSLHGIDPAIRMLEDAGFDRLLILRVLAAPSFHRQLQLQGLMRRKARVDILTRPARPSYWRDAAASCTCLPRCASTCSAAISPDFTALSIVQGRPV